MDVWYRSGKPETSLVTYTTRILLVWSSIRFQLARKRLSIYRTRRTRNPVAVDVKTRPLPPIVVERTNGRAVRPFAEIRADAESGLRSRATASVCDGFRFGYCRGRRRTALDEMAILREALDESRLPSSGCCADATLTRSLRAHPARTGARARTGIIRSSVELERACPQVLAVISSSWSCRSWSSFLRLCCYAAFGSLRTRIQPENAMKLMAR